MFMQRAVMNQRGLLYLMHSPEGDGGITLTMTMEPENQPRFLKMFYVELLVVLISLEIYITQIRAKLCVGLFYG